MRRRRVDGERNQAAVVDALAAVQRARAVRAAVHARHAHVARTSRLARLPPLSPPRVPLTQPALRGARVAMRREIRSATVRVVAWETQ